MIPICKASRSVPRTAEKEKGEYGKKKGQHVCTKRELNHFKAGFARGHVEALQAYRSHQSNARKSTSSPKSEFFFFIGTIAVTWIGSHRYERPLMRAGLVSPWVVVSI